MTMYSDMEKYFNDMSALIDSKKTYEDPGHSIDEVTRKLDEYKY